MSAVILWNYLTAEYKCAHSGSLKYILPCTQNKWFYCDSQDQYSGTAVSATITQTQLECIRIHFCYSKIMNLNMNETFWILVQFLYDSGSPHFSQTWERMLSIWELETIFSCVFFFSSPLPRFCWFFIFLKIPTAKWFHFERITCILVFAKFLRSIIKLIFSCFHITASKDDEAVQTHITAAVQLLVFHLACSDN